MRLGPPIPPPPGHCADEETEAQEAQGMARAGSKVSLYS